MSVAQDAYNWNKTMQKAMEIDPDASFHFIGRRPDK